MSIFFVSLGIIVGLGIIFLVIVLFCYLLGKVLGKDGLENMINYKGYDRLNMFNYKNKNYGK